MQCVRHNELMKLRWRNAHRSGKCVIKSENRKSKVNWNWISTKTAIVHFALLISANSSCLSLSLPLLVWFQGWSATMWEMAVGEFQRVFYSWPSTSTVRPRFGPMQSGCSFNWWTKSRIKTFIWVLVRSGFAEIRPQVSPIPKQNEPAMYYVYICQVRFIVVLL